MGEFCALVAWAECGFLGVSVKCFKRAENTRTIKCRSIVMEPKNEQNYKEFFNPCSCGHIFSKWKVNNSFGVSRKDIGIQYLGPQEFQAVIFTVHLTLLNCLNLKRVFHKEVA